VLDYFADGYRFGIKPTGSDRTSVEYSKDTDANNLDYFNHSKTFPDGIPYGVFNGKVNESLVYDFSEYVSDTDIVTVEFILKIPNYGYYQYNGFINATLKPEKSSISIFTYRNEIEVGYNTRDNNWYYPGALFPSNPLFTGSDANTETWHRYRLTKFGGILYCISDIGRTYRITDITEDQITKFQLLNCVVNANNYSEKRGSYSITQLAIYKWIDSMPPLDLNTTLWVDTPECPKEKWSMD
jgi:hypothetical protein